MCPNKGTTTYFVTSCQHENATSKSTYLGPYTSVTAQLDDQFLPKPIQDPITSSSHTRSTDLPKRHRYTAPLSSRNCVRWRHMNVDQSILSTIPRCLTLNSRLQISEDGRVLNRMWGLIERTSRERCGGGRSRWPARRDIWGGRGVFNGGMRMA